MAATQSEKWPAELDALVAAPDNHTLVLENERVRVLNTRIRPGDRTPVHTHCWSSVLHILSWSHFVRRDENENVLLDSRTVDALKNPPQVLWSGPLPPHSLENVGETELLVLSVEVKD